MCLGVGLLLEFVCSVDMRFITAFFWFSSMRVVIFADKPPVDGFLLSWVDAVKIVLVHVRIRPRFMTPYE